MFKCSFIFAQTGFVGNLPFDCVVPWSPWFEMSPGIYHLILFVIWHLGTWVACACQERPVKHSWAGRLGARSTLSCRSRCQQSYGDGWGNFEVSRLPGFLHRSSDTPVWRWLLSHLHPGCLGNRWAKWRPHLLSRVSDIPPFWPDAGDKQQSSNQSEGLYH